MPERKGRYIVIILLILLGLSGWRTLTSEQARRRMSSGYDQAQATIAQLQSERGALTAELGGARQTIAGNEQTLSTLQQQLQLVQERLDNTATQLATLRHEHDALQGEHREMAQRMDTLQTEKLALERRLSSLKELRLAIRDVKHHLWVQRWASWHARIDEQRVRDQQQLAAGNRGYVVRKGQSTLGATPRLQVHVLEPETP